MSDCANPYSEAAVPVPSPPSVTLITSFHMPTGQDEEEEEEEEEEAEEEEEGVEE
jgi:hypothetical protein